MNKNYRELFEQNGENLKWIDRVDRVIGSKNYQGDDGTWESSRSKETRSSFSVVSSWYEKRHAPSPFSHASSLRSHASFFDSLLILRLLSRPSYFTISPSRSFSFSFVDDTSKTARDSRRGKIKFLPTLSGPTSRRLAYPYYRNNLRVSHARRYSWKIFFFVFFHVLFNLESHDDKFNYCRCWPWWEIASKARAHDRKISFFFPLEYFSLVINENSGRNFVFAKFSKMPVYRLSISWFPRTKNPTVIPWERFHRLGRTKPILSSSFILAGYDTRACTFMVVRLVRCCRALTETRRKWLRQKSLHAIIKHSWGKMETNLWKLNMEMSKYRIFGVEVVPKSQCPIFSNFKDTKSLSKVFLIIKKIELFTKTVFFDDPDTGPSPNWQKFSFI